ncbi:protein SSUH2 homolog [Notolabrus celidotus]|uniref:protein SSUH2 homolog n=1 Tax=Notolabrus celidotus TaxID=1203425 RepID=UPI001490654E|nr:protein SSUH2 homolog [Notolabrus celidotus]
MDLQTDSSSEDIDHVPQNKAEDEGGIIPPPDLPEDHLQPEPSQFPQWDLVSVSKEDAQRALMQYAAEKHCRSKRPAEECVITNTESFNTHRYRLETFTETRTRRATTTSYYGQLIDNDGQPPPEIWEMQVETPPFFQDGNQIIEIPNTTTKQDCSRCDWDGNSSCHICTGSGRSVCQVCGGAGSVSYGSNRRTCSGCGGMRRRSCWKCSGSGKVTCRTCEGNKKVVISINLVVDWKNNIVEEVVGQSSGLQMSQLDEVSGKELFSHADHRVTVITNFPQPGVVQASERLLKEHRDKFQQTTRVLQQRQTIEELPITKVTYQWRGKSHVFFVYGTEQRVSAEDYPACCCCSVM